MFQKKRARALLKEATRLKKTKQIEKAIDLLNKAYEIGEYCYPSQNSQNDENTNLDNYITIEDLIRKSKYLQEIGQFDQAISSINQLIKETSKRAKESVWEIDELSTLHHHKSIILKKEKKFKEEFINRIKSYCLDGIAITYKFPKKSGDTILGESYEREVKRIRNIVNNLTDHQNLMSFIEKNLKKIELNDNQKRQLAGFMMKMILLDHNEEVYKSLKELDKLMENL